MSNLQIPAKAGNLDSRTGFRVCPERRSYAGMTDIFCLAFKLWFKVGHEEAFQLQRWAECTSRIGQGSS